MPESSNFMKRGKSQALLELTILATVFMYLLSMLIKFGVSMNQQQGLMMKSFRHALKRASSDDVASNYLNYAGQYFADVPVPDPTSANGVADLQEITSSAQATRTFFLNSPGSTSRGGFARNHYVFANKTGDFNEVLNPVDNAVSYDDWLNNTGQTNGYKNEASFSWGGGIKVIKVPDPNIYNQYTNRPKTGFTAEGLLLNVPVPQTIIRKVPDPEDKFPPDGIYWTWMAFTPSILNYGSEINYGLFSKNNNFDPNTPSTQSYQTMGNPMIMDIDSDNLGINNVGYSFGGAPWTDVPSNRLFSGLRDSPILSRGVQIYVDPDFILANQAQIMIQVGNKDVPFLTLANKTQILDAIRKQGAVFTVVAMHGFSGAAGGLRYNQITSMDISHPALADINLAAINDTQGINEYTLETNLNNVSVVNTKKAGVYSTKTNVDMKDTITRKVKVNPYGALYPTSNKGNYSIISERNITDTRYDKTEDTGWEVSK